MLDNGKEMSPSDEFTLTLRRSELSLIFKALEIYSAEVRKASANIESLGIAKIDNPCVGRLKKLEDLFDSLLSNLERTS